ncbi:toll/interleukin-1 receptor domain-containing protein [Candidatus Thiothrix anitrata]|uniref:Toll/interleukin-1 receptor domain-containing protein n=1 Tax=Candidatus Thiothrix anitrata TaxID=2823902 RepID=A0ABX7X1H1_9GAMM|nr:toll/interleukin-1 receptor domain-containing protein [Candidatus Thiothrix anitrata]QTR49112.1 toll/interleukin-1 receptor domain-containing protein [Candidatus Thiothrix anitrata]
MPPDIFISFAHVDDQPVANQQQGWITHFTNHLRNELNRRMGRKDNYHFWKDFRLQGNDAVTPEIEQQVTQANTLVILFSTGWMASPWCQRELELFQSSHPDLSKRIFVVELERVAMADKPVIMQDLLNYPFWRVTDKDRVRQLGFPVPQATDTDYFERLVDLSYDISATLKTLQTSTAQPAEPPKATVYVAPVDYPLYSQRSNLISELKQFGIAALPAANTPDPHIDANLAQCSHFVQLLDANYTMGIPCNQHFTAEVAKKPILQWRDPKLDYTGGHVPEEHRKLLEGKTVIAAPLSDFIRMVRDVVLPKPKLPEDDAPKVNGEKMVFVHASQDDFERAYQVAQALKARGYGIALPRYQGEPERIRKSIERGYLSCDVMLVLHQKAPADVVEDYLSEARVKTLQRETKLLILICQGDGAEELYFIPPGVLPLICHNNFDEHCLEQFLAEVEA